MEIKVGNLMPSDNPYSNEVGCGYSLRSSGESIFEFSAESEIGIIRVNDVLHRLFERPVKKQKLKGKFMSKWADDEVSLEYRYGIVNSKFEYFVLTEGEMIIRYKGKSKSFQVSGWCGD